MCSHARKKRHLSLLGRGRRAAPGEGRLRRGATFDPLPHLPSSPSPWPGRGRGVDTLSLSAPRHHLYFGARLLKTRRRVRLHRRVGGRSGAGKGRGLVPPTGGGTQGHIWRNHAPSCLVPPQAWERSSVVGARRRWSQSIPSLLGAQMQLISKGDPVRARVRNTELRNMANLEAKKAVSHLCDVPVGSKHGLGRGRPSVRRPAYGVTPRFRRLGNCLRRIL